jgi:hypothetical protein
MFLVVFAFLYALSIAWSALWKKDSKMVMGVKLMILGAVIFALPLVNK